MNSRTILLGVLGLVGLVVLSIILVALFSTDQQSALQSDSYFSNIQFGSAGNFAYSVFSYSGLGDVSIYSYSAKPMKKVYLLWDDQAVEATKFSSFASSMRSSLEQHDLDFGISNSSVSQDGIYIVPTGAMPSYVLSALSKNRTNFQVIYFGQKDLIISSGLKRSNWFDSLSPYARSHIIVINSSLDDFVDKGSISQLFSSILHMDWLVQNSTSMHVSGSGLKTISLPISNSSFVRVIYDFPLKKGVVDSDSFFAPSSQTLNPSPQSIFPWEKSNLEFVLNRTNGTAILSIVHNGQNVSAEQLTRVTDQNVFIRKLQFNESGDYLISISDNSGQFASGLLHVKDFSVKYRTHQGVSYVFDVYLDGVPLSDAKANVWIGNSTSSKSFYVTNGTLIVNAALPKGDSTLNIDIYGSKIQVPVTNNSDSVFDFYFKFGLPGLVLVVIVYLGAKLSRRPTYGLRFGEGVPYVRKEMRSKSSDIMGAFKKSRSDFGLGKSPITQQEFLFSLRRYVTKGADITEGNLESILKQLIKEKKIEGYKDYYQLPNEGSLKDNYLRRRIKDTLIEHGLEFDERGGKFICNDFEIGFFGDKFSKRSIIVFDDRLEIKETLSALEQSELSKLQLKIANNLTKLVPIDELGETL